MRDFSICEKSMEPVPSTAMKKVINLQKSNAYELLQKTFLLSVGAISYWLLKLAIIHFIGPACFNIKLKLGKSLRKF